jgi:chromosomal replication initiator protein
MEMTARFLATPENRQALAAIQQVLLAVAADTSERLPNPLFLHGPTGVGKSCLLAALAEELTASGRRVCRMSANDFASLDDLSHARRTDLLVVEDLQHLPTRFVGTLVQLIDQRLEHQAPMIFTAVAGPSCLQHRGERLPHRLTNRLAGGLVVAMEPMQTASRRLLLTGLAEDAQLTVAADILDWLALQLTGAGRQLTGAIRQLKALQRLHKKPLALAEVRGHFRPQVDATAPTVQRITERVGGYFRVPPKLLISAARSRDVLLPRQVSMYLARQLTKLSLQKIGGYFGGRDHKTVQHACRKVEQAMNADALLLGAVRQLSAALS